jgi:hypothetical protein
MLNKNERMNKLNAMGINTGKYFTVNLDNGTSIHLIIDEHGNPVKVEDTIANGIIEDGYVRNTKLHRRFVMAQMFEGLGYKSWDGKRTGYNEWLKNFGIKYEFEMMLEEIRVLGKLEERDKETFTERAHFFTKDVIVKTMEDYVVELEKHIDTMPTKKCKKVPYKRIHGDNIFVVDIDKKICAPLRYEINRVKSARNYNDIYKIVRSFMGKMIPVPHNAPKSKAWIDAYKGEGAFYTLKNLVMFHGCGIKDETGRIHFGGGAVAVLNDRLNKYQGEGWRMFALMKKVIADNNFDFKKRMAEVYND